MENEQEGIELETINPEEVEIPSTEEEIENEVETEGTTVETEVDEEKEQFRKSINYERNKRKAAERKSKELEARIKALEERTKEPVKSTEDELIESGVDESIAKSIAKAIDKKQDGLTKTTKEVADLKFQLKLKEISKEPEFKDIEDYSEDIKDFVDKGLSIEESYYALTGTNRTLNTKSEIERKLEKKLENKNARKEILGNKGKEGRAITSSKNKIKATAEEVQIAQLAGMSVEEYIATKNAYDISDYNKQKK